MSARRRSPPLGVEDFFRPYLPCTLDDAERIGGCRRVDVSGVHLRFQEAQFVRFAVQPRPDEFENDSRYLVVIVVFIYGRPEAQFHSFRIVRSPDT